MEKVMLGNSCGPVTKRVTVAEEVATLADEVNDFARMISDRVGVKLTPVMVCPPPDCCEQVNGIYREYPPLFEVLRNRLKGIQLSLQEIEGYLERTEL